jgi:LytS/YehU family sensor histidine kinase
MNERRNCRWLALVAVLSGALLVGPIVNHILATLYALAVRGPAALTLLHPRPAVLVEGAVTGVIGAVICSKVRYQPRLAAIRTGCSLPMVYGALMVLLQALTSKLYSFSPVDLLRQMVWLARIGFAGAATGYLTAVLALLWDEQRGRSSATPARRRPERYVI